MRTEPVKVWRFSKGETVVYLFPNHMPEDARFDIICAFQKNGYSVVESYHYPKSGRGGR